MKGSDVLKLKIGVSEMVKSAKDIKNMEIDKDKVASVLSAKLDAFYKEIEDIVKYTDYDVSHLQVLTVTDNDFDRNGDAVILSDLRGQASILTMTINSDDRLSKFNELTYKIKEHEQKEEQNND